MKWYFCAVLMGLFFLTDCAARAEFVPPHMVPLDRLIHSAEAYLKKHPDEAEAHYTLGRIYYLAFTMKRDSIPAFPDNQKTGKPTPAPDWMKDWTHEKEKAPTPSDNDLMIYAGQAKHEFDEAIERDPNNGLYHLGMASLTEEAWKWMGENGSGRLPDNLQHISINQIRQLYKKAFSLSISEDSKQTAMPMAGFQALVSYEAAGHLASLASFGEFKDNEVEDAKNSIDAIAKFEKLPLGAITPIVFSFFPGDHLSDHLATQTMVDFDLRGYGHASNGHG